MTERTPEALVEPALLSWARKSMHLSVDEAARRLHVAAERLGEWEQGNSHPTVVQLENMCGVYKRPLGVFYLKAPPVEDVALPDFRSVGGKPVNVSPELAYQMRRARERRSIALDLAEREPTPFPVRGSLSDNPEDVGAKLRELLGVTLAEQSTWLADSSLARWKEATEHLDVLVFETDGVEVGQTRGFSIYEPLFPVAVLNGADSRPARTFTLGHELAHLMLGKAGVCGEAKRDPSQPVNLEVFCNRVAASMLVPASDIAAQPALTTIKRDLDAGIQTLARRYAVSSEVIVVRLEQLGHVSTSVAKRKQSELHAFYEAARQKPRDEKKDLKIPHFQRVLKWNGRLFTQHVLSAFERDVISPADVSRYLATKMQHVDALMQNAWAPR